MASSDELLKTLNAHEEALKAYGIESSAIEPALRAHAQVENSLANPEVAANPAALKKLGRQLAELGVVVDAYRAFSSADADLTAARELLELDPEASDVQAEATALEEQRNSSADNLRQALLPHDPDDGRDVIMEIKAGTGGEEAALFAGDILRMYERFAQIKGWNVEIQSSTETDLGGIKDAQIAIRAPHISDPSQGVWAQLKYEGGVHRVQRIPVTDTQGRIQTSAAGVYVFPEADEDEEIEIDPKDIRVDTFQASGPGGQGVNTTYSAVRLTHIPTGIVVSMQDQRSQIQNRAAAMRVLVSRLMALKREEAEAQASDARRSQVRNLDRSQRIRTYNFPENRIVDHRSGYKAYNLDKVMQGDLQAVIDSCIAADEEAKLQAQAH